MDGEKKARGALKSKLVFTLIFSSVVTAALGGVILTMVNTTLSGWLVFGVLIISAIVVSLLTSMLISLFLKPLDNLTSGLNSLGQGDLNYRFKIKTGDEIEEVANLVNSLATKLQESTITDEQYKSIYFAERDKLHTTLSAITDGVIALDLSRNIILANPAALSTTGYSNDELIHHPIDQLIHIFDNKNMELSPKEYCPIRFSGPEGMVYHSPELLTLVGKNGKVAYVSLTSSQTLTGVQTGIGGILVIHDLTHEHELEKMKFDFISMASHELRTPLTSIVGYLSVFLDENAKILNNEQRGFLDRILFSTKRLITLVENLLNVSKIEEGKLTASIVPLRWEQQIDKVVQDLEIRAKQKNLVLTFNPPPPDFPQVLADPILIEEVLYNLINNAIAYTKEGGKITVYTQVVNGEAVTSVSDTGVGIPQEAIPNLFTKFFRISNKLEQSSKGTGLGLYISKEIIKKHNGRIWVESELGRGSTFNFSLPITHTTASSPITEFTQRSYMGTP